MMPDWTPAPFSYVTFGPYGDTPPPRPESLDEMMTAARDLTRGLPLVRADFYTHRGRLLLRELSLNPVGGYTNFRPEAWNERIGDWLELPDNKSLDGEVSRRSSPLQ